MALVHTQRSVRYARDFSAARLLLCAWRTLLKDCHDGTFEVLLEVLKENHRALSIDPGERKFQERLAREYADSFAKLGPLKARLGVTDRLIDQIVYRLYGLTEEEISLIERSAAGT